MTGVTWVKPETLTEECGPLAKVYRDYWWACDKDGNVAVYRHPSGSLSPIANKDPVLAAKFGPAVVGEQFEAIRQVPLVLVRSSQEEWA